MTNNNAPYYGYVRETIQTADREALDTMIEASRTLTAALETGNTQIVSTTLSDMVNLWLAMQTGNKALSDRVQTGIKQREQAKTQSFYGSKSK